MDSWGKYLRAKEPGVREKAYAWKTAIGLQKVDGLTPSVAAPERELVPTGGEQVREQVGEQARTDAIRQLAEKPSKFVQKLLRVIPERGRLGNML